MTGSSTGARVLGWVLLALPFVGAVIATQTYRHPEEGGMIPLFALALLPLLSGVLIAVDGRRHGHSGWGFAALTCAFWILFYPIYLRIRDKAEGTKHHLPVGLAGVVLLVLGFAYGNSIHTDTVTECTWQGHDISCRFSNPSWRPAQGGCVVTLVPKAGGARRDLHIRADRPIGPYGARTATLGDMMGSDQDALRQLVDFLCGQNGEPSQGCSLEWRPMDAAMAQ